MYACKSKIDTYSTSAQSVIANQSIDFQANTFLCGNGIVHAPGTSVVAIQQCGEYFIAADVVFTPTAAGAVTMQLYNNGVAVSGATATVQGTADEAATFNITKAIQVLCSCNCVNNSANLSVSFSAAGTVNSANLTVFKV